MRFYTINILDPAQPTTAPPIKQYTSLRPDGWTNPRALNVELDIPTYALASPSGAASIRIHGIGIQQINQAFDLNGKTVQVYGGMARGLPLANPDQRGLLLQGEITQAFGNWQGPNMSLDLIVQSALRPISCSTGSPARLSPRRCARRC